MSKYRTTEKFTERRTELGQAWRNRSSLRVGQRLKAGEYSPSRRLVGYVDVTCVAVSCCKYDLIQVIKTITYGEKNLTRVSDPSANWPCHAYDHIDILITLTRNLCKVASAEDMGLLINSWARRKWGQKNSNGTTTRIGQLTIFWTVSIQAFLTGQ